MDAKKSQIQKAWDIAIKYVHGRHDALTDSQEKKYMVGDILSFAEQYRQEKMKEVTDEEIEDALDEAYEKAGDNAYFANGFYACAKWMRDMYRKR